MRTALVALVLGLLVAPRAAAADPTHVRIPTQLLGEAPAPLRVTLAFGQPAVRGEPDFVSIVHVVPAGSATWRGYWWATSEAGASRPAALDVTPLGEFLDHSTTDASVQGGLIHVRYHFVGLDGSRWDYDAPPVPVLDHAPQADAPIFGGAAADDALVAFSAWNVMPRAAQIGYSLRGADGALLADERVASCADDPAASGTEAGCRVPYVIQREGAATLELWDVVDGARRIDQTVSLDAVAKQPLVAQG